MVSRCAAVVSLGGGSGGRVRGPAGRRRVLPGRAAPPCRRAPDERAPRRLHRHHRQARLSSHRICRSEEHTSELQSLAYLVCRLLLEKKKNRVVLSMERK